jgi:hypothetical protein
MRTPAREDAGITESRSASNNQRPKHFSRIGFSSILFFASSLHDTFPEGISDLEAVGLFEVAWCGGGCSLLTTHFQAIFAPEICAQCFIPKAARQKEAHG